MASKKALTYTGPKDESDVSTTYRLPGKDGDLVLELGVPTEVTDAQAKALRSDEAHGFEAGDAGDAVPRAEATEGGGQ